MHGNLFDDDVHTVGRIIFPRIEHKTKEDETNQRGREEEREREIERRPKY